MNDWINLTAVAKILGIGLLAGAGLPALFAVGLRSLSPASSATAGHGSTVHVQGNAVGTAVAGLCFAVVLAAIAYGIYLIVAG